jgi:hypothetical protein
VPRGFHFQEVARDASSQLITDTDLKEIVRIHTEQENGPLEWEESHQVSTNKSLRPKKEEIEELKERMARMEVAFRLKK